MSRYFGDYADSDEYDDIAADLRQDDEANLQYERALIAHPDCNDPDHPGCSLCEGDDECDS